MVRIRCPLSPCTWQSEELSESVAYLMYEDHKRYVHDRGSFKPPEPKLPDNYNTDNFQITRKFGETPEQDLIYKTGSVIQHETGAGPGLTPA